jgi:hypothetical protein
VDGDVVGGLGRPDDDQRRDLALRELRTGLTASEVSIE